MIERRVARAYGRFINADPVLKNKSTNAYALSAYVIEYHISPTHLAFWSYLKYLGLGKHHISSVWFAVGLRNTVEGCWAIFSHWEVKKVDTLLRLYNNPINTEHFVENLNLSCCALQPEMFRDGSTIIIIEQERSAFYRRDPQKGIDIDWNKRDVKQTCDLQLWTHIEDNVAYWQRLKRILSVACAKSEIEETAVLEILAVSERKT